MSEWRNIRCSDVNWHLLGAGRVAWVLKSLCRVVPEPTEYNPSGDWAHLTLGQLADMGVKAWTRPTGMGAKGVEAIKAIIDAAAEGQNVTTATDAYVPKVEREAPIVNPASVKLRPAELEWPV